MSNASVIEAMLLRWGEGPTGRTVTLLLPDDTPHHPFKGLRSGPSNGQRLGCAFTLIADDETTTPVDPPSTAPEKPKGGRLAQQAAICCQDARFRRFLGERDDVDMPDADVAATWVRFFCGVLSRAELDTDPAAAERWRELHGDYILWRDNP